MKQKLPLGGFLLLFFLFLNSLTAQTVFINEIHYDNAGADTGEGVEVAGPAGTDLLGWSIVLYNGSNNSTYGRISLEGSIPDLQGGFGTLAFFGPSIQNGSPDGLALISAEGEVIQFLSYEGTITALEGPAAGMTSKDIGVSQDGTDPEGHSLQLAGEGNQYADFTWQTSSENTFGAINTNQDFGGEITNPNPDPDPDPEPEPQPAPANSIVFINEIHYDNYSTDVDEGVEIAGTAGTDLSGYEILLYNGSASQLKLYSPKTNLSGVIPEQQNGYGTIFFPIANIQNGDPDGIALVSPEGDLIQFLSYGGVFTPTDGPAAGIESTDIGVTESSSTPVGYSLQLTGEGSYYEDFTWTAEAPNTYGEVNNTQIFLSPEPVLFINEFHYDTYSTDSGEGIEVAGTAGLDLSEYSILFYNGSNGEVYKTQVLSGILPNLQSGFGTMEFYVSGIQNGSPDGFALVKGEEVIQFLSYEGTFTAVGGAADGMESTDIGVSESAVTTGFSLQLGGVGFNYDDFTWQEAQANTFGAVNTNQTFGSEAIEPEPEPEPTEPGTIAHARAAEVGTKLIIEGTLTVTDHHGNTAFIQDETGGMALFGNLVTEAGKFQIGDSIRVTGTRAIYNELIQLSDLEAVEYLGAANEPIAPKEITLAELGNYRGQLVKITDMTFPDPGQLFFGNANYLVSDVSGEAELRIDSDIAALVGKVQPETCAEVVGVVGRYNNINQLLPRMFEDLPCAEEFDPSYPGSDISKDLTFEAVAWNIEWFGDEDNSPAARHENSDEIQKEAVKAALLKLDADVIAVNEISDDVLFEQMVSEMEGYDFILSAATSYPDSPGGQKVGFIYKTSTVNLIDSRPLLTELHPFYNGGDHSLLPDYPESADRFFASGRLPFLMEAIVTINGHSQEMKFIALHARANGSSGAQNRYDMRKYDVEKLKDYIDSNFSEDHVMILGDYNDDLDFTVANVTTTVTTYDSYLQDNENYSFPTLALSEAGYRTYVAGNYNDMIDHIMITNELDYSYMEGSARVHYELYNSDYAYTTSDHFPVSIRLVLSELQFSSVDISGVICSEGDTVNATVAAEGGIAPYTYTWSNGQETETATGLSAGTYSIEVTDVLGRSISTEVVISEATPIALTLVEDKTLYTGYETSCTTVGAVEINGGSGEYTYEWSTGETSASIEVCPTETTVFSLTVTDSLGCTAEATVTVNVEDVSCGKKGDKVLLCHNGKSICVAPQAVEALLRIGATFGACEDLEIEVAIEELSAWPNPTLADAQIRVTATKAFKGNLNIYDLNGSPVSQQEILVNEGATDFPITLGNLPKGIYLVKIHAAGFESHGLKLIKK